MARRWLPAISLVFVSAIFFALLSGDRADALVPAAETGTGAAAPAADTATTNTTPVATDSNTGTCGDVGALLIFSDGSCVANNADIADSVAKVSAFTIGGPAGVLVQQFNSFITDNVVNWDQQLIDDELGTLGDKSALASPKFTEPWFVGQLAIMRTLGLYIIIPLLMLVTIQAIVRGSMFFLLRAFLIMLPAAILGAAMIVVLTQLLSGIADEMAGAIASTSGSINDYSTGLKSTMKQMDPGGFGLFAWFWMFVFLISGIAVAVELVLRQIGMYLSTLFLPFFFAALVWPPATRYARRLVELLLGLIFSKVFLVAAISLGIAAFGHIGQSTTNAGNGKASITLSGIESMMTGSVVLLMAAFAGGKILSLTPSATSAAEGYVINRGGISGKGAASITFMARRYGKAQKRLGNVQAGTNFKNLSDNDPRRGQYPHSGKYDKPIGPNRPDKWGPKSADDMAAARLAKDRQKTGAFGEKKDSPQTKPNHDQRSKLDQLGAQERSRAAAAERLRNMRRPDKDEPV